MLSPNFAALAAETFVETVRKRRHGWCWCGQPNSTNRAQNATGYLSAERLLKCIKNAPIPLGIPTSFLITIVLTTCAEHYCSSARMAISAKSNGMCVR